MDYQQNQNIKNILYKESLVKISLDKDFEHLFDQGNESVGEEKYTVNNLIEVTN